ncbi:hypothetical protein ACP86_21845 [Marinobacter sp. CP1]|jgi:hypothetical protein|uniref:PA14 domain-containing protein n=1 Tax=unclassified Marinobacter TaxID=83889 RepID=UPI00069CD9ED|nr:MULTISPECIES: PA14 domain-containing protein [unclassified Marinobacter]AKV98548.1 hypothetical protein ACP86_21845 [Marinobacter sp. CP1]
MSIIQRSLLFCAPLLISGCQSWQFPDVGSLPPTAALPETSQQGVVHAFYWDNVQGNTIESLTSLEAFPNAPDDIVELTSLSGPTERGDNYGTLVRGFIEAPVSGEYRFFVSGDDETEFWLSPSRSTAEATLLATVPGWTYLNEFDKYSSQASPVQVLSAGQQYYFEIRHKEASGGDRYSVAWEGPGLAREVIAGQYLYSLATGPDLGVQEAYSLGYRVGFLDASEGLAFNTEFPPLDRDADGLYDNWEVVHGLNPGNPDDAVTDPDNDLLSAADEFLLGTSENNQDTDNDGIPDGTEFALGLNPLDPSDAADDLDGDGFTNLEEYTADTAINDPEDKPEQQAKYLAGFSGQYFKGNSFNQFLSTRVDRDINFDWGNNAPMSEVPADYFSIRWIGWFTAPHQSGSRDYRFIATTDDGVRLYLNNQLVIDDWTPHAPTAFSADITVEAGQTIPVIMEFFEKAYGAVAKLEINDLSNNTSISTSSNVQTIDPSTNHSTDTDSDGIPDTWELQYGLNPLSADAASVVNTANISNLEAYEAGLNPWTLEPLANGESSADAPETGVTDGDEPITLSWTAPSTRVDGTSIALSEIDYYVINYGQDSENLTESQQVGGEESSFTFDGLGAGTWYFTIRVVDIDGLSSPASEPVSAVVN